MGYLRLFLALNVMVSHLVYVGNEFGGAAMISFYIISGYSITASGIKPGFWPRRFWRLWPSYIAIALVVQWALILGWEPGFPGIGIARGWNLFVQSLLIVPTGNVAPALVHSAWMVKWILLGYLAMWLGATKTPRRSASMLVSGSVLSVLLLARNGFFYYYISPVAALTSTAVGACCWHLGLIAPRDGYWAAWAGALSYPVFLSHYAIGAAIMPSTGLGFGWPLFWASLGPTLAVSIALVVLVEKPVDRFRKSLKKEK